MATACRSDPREQQQEMLQAYVKSLTRNDWQEIAKQAHEGDIFAIAILEIVKNLEVLEKRINTKEKV